VHVLRFTIEETRYAVAVDRVVEVCSRVLMTPLPDAPTFIEGVFSFRQAPCVGISLRRRLGHPDRAPRLEDHVLIVRGRRRLLGLVVDRAQGDELVADERIEEPPAGGRHIAGIVALADGLLLVQDVDAMLTDEEEQLVDRSLGAEGA
jgi:purine-binding chemotaxis protein CheW